MRKIIILVLVIAAVLAGGYYYWEIYRVPTAAMDLMLTFQDYWKATQKLESSRPQDTDDYARILSGIEIAKGSANSVEEKLSEMWLPFSLKEIRADMLEVVRTFDSLMAQAETRAKFMNDLSDMVRTLIPKEMDRKLGSNATVSDLSALWADAIPKMKVKGDALFQREPVELSSVSYGDLQAKWLDARDHFDTILTLVRAQNQKMLVRDFRLDQVKMDGREKLSFERATAFMEAVERAIRENSAYDIINKGAGGKPVQELLQQKSAELNAAFKRFADANPELVKKIEAKARSQGLKP